MTQKKDIGKIVRDFGLAAVVLLIIIVMSFLSESFLTNFY